MDTTPNIFDDLDQEAEKRAWAEGEADADVGRVVPHEAVAAWLKSWGAGHKLPPPPWERGRLEGGRR